MKYIFIILFTLTICNEGRACKCRQPTLRKAFKESSIVVSVTILEILPSILPVYKTVKDGDTLIRQPSSGFPKRILINTVYKGEKLADTMII